MEAFLNVTVGGLISGGVYALVLLGILMIFRVSNAVNFAHGALAMFAAFGGWYLATQKGWGWWAALVVSLAVVALLSAATGRLLETIPPGNVGFDLVTTLGVLLVLTAVAQMAFGVNTYAFPPLGTRTQLISDPIHLNANDLLVLGLVAVAFLGFYLVLSRTQVGLSLQLVAEDASISSSLGINVARLRTVVWCVAGLLAGVSGIIAASRTSVDAIYMTPFLLKAFVAGIIGGLDRFAAPLTIAILLGVYESWSTYLFGADASTAAVFLLVMVVLFVAPKRFLEERHEARA